MPIKPQPQELFAQLGLFEECDAVSNVTLGSASDAISTIPAKVNLQHEQAAVDESMECAIDVVPQCDWSEFYLVNGRVPKLGDLKQPWEYKGWLMWYRFLCETNPNISPRWTYWLETRAARKLLDGPIPQVTFDDFGNRECQKLLENWLHTIDRLHSHWSPMDTLLDWLLWGFGLSKEPPQITPKLNEELYKEVNLGPLLLQPHDYLGEWIADQKGKWNPHAFFPTPHCVVEMMMRMVMDTDQDLRSAKVLEPALGSGRMLLHASNHSLRLWGMDIDPMMVKTSLVNGALYAPWMVRPFPDSYFPQSNPDEPKSTSDQDDEPECNLEVGNNLVLC